MRRIGLVVIAVGLGLGSLFNPLVADAQHVGKVHRVGLIFTTSPVSEMVGAEPIHPSARAFVHGLRAHGYVDGQNFILERRSAEGRFERFGDIVAELVRLKTDVIVAPGDPIPRAAMAITTTVPIVMATGEDPVGAGLVQSLARPGGNVTGLMLVVGPEIEGKRLEIFREALPGVSRVAYLGSKQEKEWEGPWGQSVQTAARALGVTLVLAEFPSRQYADAFAQVTRARAEALFVSRAYWRSPIEHWLWSSRPGLGCQPCLRIGSRWSSGGGRARTSRSSD